VQRIAEVFDSIEELEAASGGWSLAFCQLGRGRLTTALEQMGTDRAILSRIRFNRALDQRGCPPPGLLTFGFLENHGPSIRWCGRDSDGRSLLNFNGPGGFESVSQPGHHGFTFSIPEDQFTAVAGTVGARAIERCMNAVARASSFSTPKLGGVRALARGLCDALRRDPGLLMSSPFLERLEFELPYRLVSALVVAELDFGSYTSRQRAIKKARVMIEDLSGSPPTVQQICEHSGVSWRTLDYAFREHFDMTPQAYLKAVRLDKARRFLRKGSYATVAQAARECGFGHMGKFATDYRIQFGELPSDTLRRTQPSEPGVDRLHRRPDGGRSFSPCE